MINFLTNPDVIIVFKLFLSVALGMIIGMERKKRHSPGGSRTFALVCFGATLIAIIDLKLMAYPGINTDFIRLDMSRLLSYGLASIGFLGSGVIIQSRNKMQGITTASTLWVAVCLGFLVGLGFYWLAVLSTALIYFILEWKYWR